MGREAHNVDVPHLRHHDAFLKRSAIEVAPVVLSLDKPPQPISSREETAHHKWLRWFSRRRRFGLFVAGGICALGVVIALSNPADSPSEPSGPSEFSGQSDAVAETAPSLSASDGPNRVLSTQGKSDRTSVEADRDPRAVVVDLALSGGLDGISKGIEDVTAEVASRNGDIVLVDVVAITKSTQSSFSVVLVRSADSWVVREVYPSEDPSEPSPTS